ncbi:MAG: response regulator [bacterium]
MIEVAIVEDDDTVRESLAILINGATGFECIGKYPDCESAMSGILEDPPDIVLMDLSLPGKSGIEGIHVLKRQIPDLDFLVLTIHRDKKLVFDALCAGACGYLEKDTQPAKLLEAIKETFEGGAPMSSSIARMVVGSFQRNTPATPLTERESEVLKLLCRGKSYKMIAASLYISEETVHSHIKNIYKKMQVRSKSEAVAKAYQENLVY